MSLKPPGLLFGVDERPDWFTMTVLAVQHVFVLSVGFIFPVVVVDAIGGTPAQTAGLISLAMIATGIGTILQSFKKGPVGSGFLCPLLNGPAFVSASILAGKTGGLSLIFGMTAVGGVFEALFSRIVPKMRAIFPAEVTGTIVTMVGIEVIPLAVKRYLGMDSLHPEPQALSFWVASATLLAMVSFNVWGKGKLRLYSMLLGLLFGYALSAVTGLLGTRQLHQVLDAPLFTLPPIGAYGLSFRTALLVPFLVATLSSALKAMGDVTICQKANDPGWKRPDMQSISKGILACAIGNLVSGLTGGLGQSVSSSNIGLSIATGATSRAIAYPAGILLILLAFLPKLASVYVIMPPPVMGACLIFSVSFMILAGIQIMMSRMVDSRKTFVIGISLIFGLSIDFIPGLADKLPAGIQPLFTSSLSVATVCAILLNLLFRIGIGKSIALEWVQGASSLEEFTKAVQKQGGVWGARKDVIDRVVFALNDFLETATAERLFREKIDIVLSFDEFNLDAEVRYAGALMDFPTARPSIDEVVGDASCLPRLSGFLIRRHADSIQSTEQNGNCTIRFHFDH